MNPPSIPPDAFHLLRSFDVVTLGEGDPAAGLNTLVSFCATLSAIAGPGAAITSPQDGPVPVGIHSLTAGSLSVALLSSRVLDPLRDIQNAVSANAMRGAVISHHHAAKKNPVTVLPGKSPVTPELMASARDSLLLDSLKTSEDEGITFESGASRLIRHRAFSDQAEFITRPGIFFDGLDPKLLSRQLAHCHYNHPLVHFPIGEDAVVARVQPACFGIMDGCALPFKVPSHVKGFVVAQMPADVLKRVVDEDRDNSRWPYRTLWLVDAPMGTLPPRDAGIVRLDGIQDRYVRALKTLVIKRYGEKAAEVVSVPGYHRFQVQVVKHLLTLEDQLPGIAGALRNLFPTLVFGLVKLVAAGDSVPKGFTYSLPAIACLAVYLSDRMVHSFMGTRYAEYLARKQKLAGSICQRLQERPHSVTELIRRHNRLHADVCREVLEDLQATGVVALEGDRWQLVHRPGLSDGHPPVIDVL